MATPVGQFVQNVGSNSISLNNNSNKNRLISAFISQFVNQPFIEDIINISIFNVEYNNVAQAGKTSDAMGRIKKFLIDCNKDLDTLKALNLQYPITMIKSSLRFARQVLELRNAIGSRLISYDNLLNHFPGADLNVQKMITNIKAKSITNLQQFRLIFDTVMQTVQLSEEIRNIRKTLIEWDGFLEDAEKGNLPLLNMASGYRDLLINSYSELTNLKVINKVSELSNFMLISDEQSITKIAEDITSYLGSGYTFYKSGYSIIDDNIGGIESSNVHIICGPSNNCKSIFMINIMWQMILNNIHEFQDNDLFLFFTLEDDIYKLIRRFLAIFGNYDSAAIKMLFIKASELLKKQKNTDIKGNSQAEQEVKKIFQDILTESIFKITGKRMQIILQHSRDNSTSPSDIVKFIDARRCEGYRVRALFIDYIDVMVPSSSRYSDYADYNAHGMITQELRNIAGEYSLPVLTITQGTRNSESVPSMSNEMIADSHKKVRYSDYIYMVRQRPDLNLLTDDVKRDILDPSEQQLGFTDMTNQNNTSLVVFEVKITKAKDGAKNMMKYHLFSQGNLRIYEKLKTFYGDLPQFQQRSRGLLNSANMLSISAMQASPVQSVGLDQMIL